MSKLMATSMVVLIIFIMTALTVLIFYDKLKLAYDRGILKQECKTSILATSKLNLRYDDFSGEIKCPTIPIKINDNNEEVIKKKMADAMYDCWDQFGRGQEDLFTDDNIYCTICHRITLDKSIKVNEFNKYLATQIAPNQKITYLQFLTAERTDNSEFLKESEKQKISDSIDASKMSEYAVIFTYIKGKESLKEFSAKASYAAPGAGLIAVGVGAIYLGTGAASIPVIGWPVSAAAYSIGTTSFVIGSIWSYLSLYFAGVPFEHISLISLIPYNAENIKSLNCKELPIKQS